MKKQILALALAASTFWAACGNSETDDENNDTTMAATTTEPATGTTGSGDYQSSQMVNSDFDESGSYVDLKTKKPVRLKKGTDNNSSLVNSETNEPFSYFFYSPATRDTFDRWGNVVNNYLITGTGGDYMVDEDKWRMKVDEDGDIKMKDHDDSKVKYDASSGKTKIKTGDTTIKIP